MNGRQAHRMGTFVLSLAMAAIGVALIVEALSGQTSSPAAYALLGVLFVAGGGARCYVEVRRSRGT
ncbi:MAG TPA: hypothetical protein VKV16_02625 [Solirubrobacteraceae bacterium]|nr:hypothetical protein [Solirubrobacteraceae bacterium]